MACRDFRWLPLLRSWHLGMLTLFVAACSYGDSSQERLRTEETLTLLEGGLSLYHANTGKMPVNLSATDLVKDVGSLRLQNQSIEVRLRELNAYVNNAQAFTDGWSNPITIVQDAAGRISIISSGKDTKSGTADDVIRYSPR